MINVEKFLNKNYFFIIHIIFLKNPSEISLYSQIIWYQTTLERKIQVSGNCRHCSGLLAISLLLSGVHRSNVRNGLRFSSFLRTTDATEPIPHSSGFSLRIPFLVDAICHRLIDSKEGWWNVCYSRNATRCHSVILLVLRYLL